MRQHKLAAKTWNIQKPYSYSKYSCKTNWLLFDSAYFLSCFILVLTEFLTCPRRQSPIDCEETVYTEEGQPVIFDTRLVYNTGSVCQCNQRIGSYLFSGTGVGYTCNDPGNCISTLGKITNYYENLDNSYNFSLQLHSPKPENGSLFLLQVVGLYPPGIDGTYTVTKTFTLYIIPPSKLAALFCNLHACTYTHTASTMNKPSTVPPTNSMSYNHT